MELRVRAGQSCAHKNVAPGAPALLLTPHSSRNHSLRETKITIHLENEINSFKLSTDHRETSVGWCLAEGQPADSWPQWLGGRRGPPVGSPVHLCHPPSSDEGRLPPFLIRASSEPRSCPHSSSENFSGRYAAASSAPGPSARRQNESPCDLVLVG